MSIAELPQAGPHRRARLLVAPANLSGSVEHFYHFFFGYLLPFVEHCHGLRSSHRFALRDCGPMNRIFGQLDGFIIDVTPVHAVLSGIVGTTQHRASMPRIIAPGFDAPNSYSLERFARIRRIVSRLYGAQIAAHAARYGSAASERLVLLVDRGPPPPEHLAPTTEIRSGGSERRSVPNMTEIHAAIAGRHDTLLVRLEECSLFEQIFLFSRAWRVVAQHGAALAHLLWARPDAGLIEILPNPDRLPPHRIKGAPYFSGLCETLGLPRQVVEQDHDHAAVKPGAILAALDAG